MNAVAKISRPIDLSLQARRFLSSQIVPQKIHDEASAVVAMIDAEPRVSPDALRKWLFELNATVSNPLSQGAFALRTSALVRMFADIPAWVFSDRLLFRAMEKFKFAPSAAELTELVADEMAKRKTIEVEARALLSKSVQEAVECDESKKTSEDREKEQRAVSEAVLACREALKKSEQDVFRAQEVVENHIPGPDKTIRGWVLINALEAELSRMTGEVRDLTIARIANLKRAQEMVDQIDRMTGGVA